MNMLPPARAGRVELLDQRAHARATRAALSARTSTLLERGSATSVDALLRIGRAPGAAGAARSSSRLTICTMSSADALRTGTTHRLAGRRLVERRDDARRCAAGCRRSR